MQNNNSQNATIILNNLKKQLYISSDKALADTLNVRPNTISNWKKRDSLDYKSIIDLCSNFNLDLNKIFYDKNVKIKLKKQTPLITRKKIHEYVMGELTNLKELPSYYFPFIKTNDSRIFQVNSNNMFPVIEENAFVICESHSLNSLHTEQLIVCISKTKGFYINRFGGFNDDKIRLFNENYIFTDHELILSKKDIDEVWLIKGIVLYDIQNVNNKLGYLNTSLKRLDQVLLKKHIK